MAIIELKKKSSFNSRNTFSNDIRIGFSSTRRSSKTGKNINVFIVWIGKEICQQIGLKDIHRVSLEIDTDKPECFLIKKDTHGYKISPVGSALKASMLWKFDIPDNNNQTRVVRHEITPRGIMVYMKEIVD